MKKHCVFTFVKVLVFSTLVAAADFSLAVKDQNNKPVENAVVAIKPLQPLESQVPPSSGTVQIIQKDKTFIPFVTVLRTGEQVEFPNYDSVQHHVYSFSKPKVFDIPLYKQIPPNPISFDKPGVVVLGCNIHDWMKAYIFVVDAPFFAKTAENGELKIKNVPASEYQVELWHPYMTKVLGEGIPAKIKLAESQEFSLSISVHLKKVFQPSRAQSPESRNY